MRVVGKPCCGTKPHNAGCEVLCAVVRANLALEKNSGLNFAFVSLAKRCNDFDSIRPKRLWRSIERRTGDFTADRCERCIHFSIAASGGEHRMHPAYDKTTIRAKPDQMEALLAALVQVRLARRGHAAKFTSFRNGVFNLEQLF